MPRLHLFEFNDQPWLPTILRDALTGYLESLSRKLGFHKPMVPVVEAALKRSGAGRIVDLCSGGGGPILEIRERLAEPVPLVLTDKFPNQEVFESAAGEGVSAHLESVDATDVPAELTGMRTIINALHHFRPPMARSILADAADRNEAIVMIELTERKAQTILTSPLIILFTLFLMPAVRPMRWQYLLFTYLIPIVPLLVFWDGLVSHLRAYTIPELVAMTDGLGDAEYRWHAERIPVGSGAYATVLTGMPGVG